MSSLAIPQKVVSRGVQRDGIEPAKVAERADPEQSTIIINVSINMTSLTNPQPVIGRGVKPNSRIEPKPVAGIPVPDQQIGERPIINGESRFKKISPRLSLIPKRRRIISDNNQLKSTIGSYITWEDNDVPNATGS